MRSRVDGTYREPPSPTSTTPPLGSPDSVAGDMNRRSIRNSSRRKG